MTHTGSGEKSVDFHSASSSSESFIDSYTQRSNYSIMLSKLIQCELAQRA